MNIFHKELGGKKVRTRNGYNMAKLDATMREDQEREGFCQGRERKRSDIEGARQDNSSRGWTTATRGEVRLGRRRRRKRAMTTKRMMTKKTTTKRKRRRLDWPRKRRRRRKMTTI